MATIHFIQQGKGGVGKSYVASLFYQALRHFGKDVHAYDVDPVNATLAGYSEFNVTRAEIMDGDKINPLLFDKVMNSIAALPDNAHAIIDNGASSFVALNDYMKDSNLFHELRYAGHTVYFHTIMSGGQALLTNARYLKSLAETFPDAPLVVWLNPYFGAVEVDGRPFKNFKVYEDLASHIVALIYLPDVNKDLTGKAIDDLCVKRISFEAGINSTTSTFMVRSRLKKYWSKVLELIHETGIIK